MVIYTLKKKYVAQVVFLLLHSNIGPPSATRLTLHSYLYARTS